MALPGWRNLAYSTARADIVSSKGGIFSVAVLRDIVSFSRFLAKVISGFSSRVLRVVFGAGEADDGFTTFLPFPPFFDELVILQLYRFLQARGTVARTGRQGQVETYPPPVGVKQPPVCGTGLGLRG